MLKFKLALLNVFRNSRRSLITLLAIQFGVVSLIIFAGFVSAMYEGMRENMIRSQLGHIQIYQAGFSQYGSHEPQDYLISQANVSLISKMLEAMPEIEIVTPRLNLTGLLANSSGRSLSVVVEGIEPNKEALLSSAVKLTAGEDLFSEDLEGGLIGEGLFKALNLRLGDYVTLMTTTSDGGIDARDVQVTGTISTGSRELDSRLLRMNIAHAQDLMFTQGATRLVVLLKDTKQTQLVMNKLESEFKALNLPMELRSWEQLADYYHEVVNLFNGMFDFVKVIVLLMVLLSISNTMVMVVMERTPEIGTIRALGGTRKDVIWLFMSEAMILGLIGSLLGVVIAVLLAHGITASEIMMPTPPGSSENYPIRIFIQSNVLVTSAGLGLLIAIVSSIYPAIKASRMVIINSLRFA
jgi:putative ABC transport system permease protein